MFRACNNIKIGNKNQIKPEDFGKFDNIVKLDDFYYLVEEYGSKGTTYTFINSEGFVCNYNDLPARIRLGLSDMNRNISSIFPSDSRPHNRFVSLENRNSSGELIKDYKYPTLIYARGNQTKVSRQERQLVSISNGVATDITYGEARIHKIIKKVRNLYYSNKPHNDRHCCPQWYLNTVRVAIVMISATLIIPSIVAVVSSYYFSS